jgi:hypothetical protein
LKIEDRGWKIEDRIEYRRAILNHRLLFSILDFPSSTLNLLSPLLNRRGLRRHAGAQLVVDAPHTADRFRDVFGAALVPEAVN